MLIGRESEAGPMDAVEMPEGSAGLALLHARVSELSGLSNPVRSHSINGPDLPQVLSESLNYTALCPLNQCPPDHIY